METNAFNKKISKENTFDICVSHQITINTENWNFLLNIADFTKKPPEKILEQIINEKLTQYRETTNIERLYQAILGN